MLKIKDGARAWQFTGDMFSAVDIIRSMEQEHEIGDRMAPTFDQKARQLAVYCPVSDRWQTANSGDWIVKTEGSRILIYDAGAFIFAFNE